jgi:hypothetical protein
MTDIANVENERILDFLRRRAALYPGELGADPPAFVLPDRVEKPYRDLRAQPDVVEQIWNRLGAALPMDCRAVVYGTPGLVHPLTGIVFALAIGTRYGLRLPGALPQEAVRAGAPTSVRWTNGGGMNIQDELGEDWIFGWGVQQEQSWCLAAYEAFGKTALSR